MKRVLLTERLRLRAPQPGDEQAAFDGWARDPDVLRYLGWRPHTSIADTRAQLEWDQARWLKRSAWTWLVIQQTPSHHAVAAQGDRTPALQKGTPIGLVQLVPQRFDGPAHHLRLGCLLTRSCWGQGLMREAVAAVLAEAFDQSAVWRVDALCDVDNRASARLFDTLGFAREGVLRCHSLHPNVGDEPRDVTVHARLRPQAVVSDPAHGTSRPDHDAGLRAWCQAELREGIRCDDRRHPGPDAHRVDRLGVDRPEPQHRTGTFDVRACDDGPDPRYAEPLSREP